MSIRKIAELAGVSIATVSNVLNNKGRVSEETVEHVKRVAKENNFSLRPRSAAAPRVKRIAFAATDDIMDTYQSFIQTQLVSGIQSVLDRKDYSLVLSSRVDADSIARQIRDAAAVILIGFPQDPDAFTHAAGKPVVWVLIDRCDSADVVQEDNREVGRLVAQHFLANGHTRVAYLDDDMVDTVGERGRCLERFMRDGGGKAVRIEGSGIFRSVDNKPGVDAPQTAKMLDRLLGMKDRPTGLFVPGDLLCVEVYSLLRKRGVEPLADLHIVSCNNDIPYVGHLDPRPPVVDLNFRTIGQRAAETALWRMENPEEDVMRVVVRPTLLE